MENAPGWQRTADRDWLNFHAPADNLPASRLGLLRSGLLLLTLALLPVYIFSSGRPQLVDGPLLILIIVQFLRRSPAEPFLRQNITTLLPLIIWIVLVNSVYFIFFPNEFGLWFKNAEFVYNLCIYICFSYLFFDLLKGSKNLWPLYLGIFLSFILLFTVKGYSEEELRSVLSFNNPNQLGYYALIIACLTVLLLHYKEKYLPDKTIFFWADVIILFMAHFLALLSLSRGALLGLLLLDIWFFPRLTRKILLLLVPTVMLALVVLIWRPAVIEQKLAGRPEREITQKEIQYEVRSRIFHQLSIMDGYQYLVGRGARGISFKEKARGIGEVHNIFGEIFRSYGLIGLGLLVFWLGRFIWRSRVLPGGLFIWGALLLYNLTHYGLRFRFFWILLGLVNVMLVLEWSAREEQPATAPQLQEVEAAYRP